MRRTVSDAPRGFTLLEVMVAAVIAGFVMTGIASAFIIQAKQFQMQSGRRISQGSARQALVYMERELRNAGYGVDPDRVFLAYDGYKSDFIKSGGAEPTGTTADYPDAITFHSRDPLFARNVVAGSVSNTAMQIDVGLTETMYKGQILLLVCRAADTYAYVVLGQQANAGDVRLAIDNGSAPATGESPISAPGSRYREQARLTASTGKDKCFSSSGVTLAKVNRFSFFVASLDDDADSQTPDVPYLMMHRGIDVGGGPSGPDAAIDAKDASPVAQGIEQFQVAYVMNSVDATQPRILGLNSTMGAPAWGASWQTALPPPIFTDSYSSTTRLTDNAANVRQVRLTLVGRAPTFTPGYAGDDAYTSGSAWGTGDNLPNGQAAWKQLENAAPVSGKWYYPAGGNYLRTVARMSVVPKNLLMRNQFHPLPSSQWN